MKKFLSFVKIEHTLFSLPMIYAGMALGLFAIRRHGDAAPDTALLVREGILILLAATGARTVGFALNRIIDRRIDAKNPRTAGRELPSGRLSLRQAYLVVFGALIVYVASAAALNPLCLMLSPIPLAVFAIYPFMKRFTSLAHLGVGASLSFGPIGGYLAVRPTFDGAFAAILLSLFAWCWVSGFDIIYATADEQFDKQEGLHSLPSRFGAAKALRISAYIHVLSFLLLVGVYLTAFAGSVVALVLLVVSGMLLYLEQKKSTDVELAFFKINAVLGFVVLLFVVVGVTLA